MPATVLPFATHTAAKRFGVELRRALAAFGYAVPGWVVAISQDGAGNDVAWFHNTAWDDGSARFNTDWDGHKLVLWDNADPWGDPLGTFGTGAELVAAVRRLVRA